MYVSLACTYSAVVSCATRGRSAARRRARAAPKRPAVRPPGWPRRAKQSKVEKVAVPACQAQGQRRWRFASVRFLCPVSLWSVCRDVLLVILGMTGLVGSCVKLRIQSSPFFFFSSAISFVSLIFMTHLISRRELSYFPIHPPASPEPANPALRSNVHKLTQSHNQTYLHAARFRIYRAAHKHTARTGAGSQLAEPSGPCRPDREPLRRLT